MVVNKDHCGSKPTMAILIAAVYTGLGLFAQNNFSLESSGSGQLNPMALVKERLGADFFLNRLEMIWNLKICLHMTL